MTVREQIHASGIRRSGGPRNGFRYRRASGASISSAELRRISNLKIPPAWTQVSIARSPRSIVQAVGQDAAGRWQYLYLPGHTERRARAKFDRLIAFGRALPALRQTLERDLRLRGLPREKALACAVAIMATCFLRSGSEEYAEMNGTFGLATLRRRHVTVTGRRIRFSYRGKHGLRQRHEVANERLATIVAVMLRYRGDEVFKYIDEDGRVCDVSRRQINQYVKQTMGSSFSARDFRTWAGSWICAGTLARTKGEAGSPDSRRRAIAAAVRETADYLGNTERVCRGSYVHPGVLLAFERGETVRCPLPRPEEVLARGGAGLDRAALALIELLSAAAPRRN